MKNLLKLSGLAVALLQFGCAGPPSAGGHAGHGAAAATVPGSADAAQSAMQDHMKKMQMQMEKIRATSDPTEKQKLMQEHMQAMHEGMGMMCGMSGGGGCMGGGMMGGGMKDGAMKQGGMMQGGMMKHHEMMEKRMDMMQSMMQQMIEREMQEQKSAGESPRK